MRVINSALVWLVSKGINKISCEVDFTFNLSTKSLVLLNFNDWVTTKKTIKTLKCIQICYAFLAIINLKTVSNTMWFFKNDEFDDAFISDELFWRPQNALYVNHFLKN